MKLLVTGGAGFIGSEFVRQVAARGVETTVVDKLTYAGDTGRLSEVEEKVNFINADINDRERIKEIFSLEKPDHVVNFAAETHVDRSILNSESFITTNVSGTFCLLDEAVRAGNIEKFLHISTDEVYGELGEEGEFTEESPFDPSSPYSASKASADMLVRAYSRTYGLPCIIARPSNNYGPWQYPEKLIPLIIVKALSDETIPVYGRGMNIREWLYVEDCAGAIFSLLDKGDTGEAYNIGSGIELRNIEVIETILSILGKPDSLIKFIKDRPGHDYRYALSSKKIERASAWKAGTDFKAGIEKTVSWYLDNKKWLFKKASELDEYWNRVYGS